MRQKYMFIVLSFCALSWPLGLHAQETARVYQGFTGGMVLHAGYLSGIDASAPVTPQGLTTGIGGALRVNLGKLLRVGIDGYVSTLSSNHSNARSVLSDGSYIRTGSGGLLADLCWRQSKWWPYIGFGVGGGSMKGLYILDGSQDDWAPESSAVYNKQSFFYLSPYLGTDFCLTPRVHLTFKVDWMLAVHDGALLKPSGPRGYFGFMFCH